MGNPVLIGKEPAPQETGEETREFRLAKSLVTSSCALIRPYFLRHLPETTPPRILLEDISLNNFMEAKKTETENHLTISRPLFRESLDFFPKSRDERAYNCAHFLNGVVHELIHFSQPLNTPRNGTYIEWIETHREWIEGTAYLVSWLLLSDLYRDSKSELWFWIFHKSPDAMKKAIEQKRIRVGLERVMAIYNYYFYLAFQRCQISIPYAPPYFLPEPTRKLYNQMVAAGSLPFPTSIGKKQTTKIKKDEYLDPIFYLVAAARGIIVGASLLQKNAVTVRDLVQNPIPNEEMENLFKEATKKW